MILFDGIFINNGGGKILQDYLIRELHNSELDVYYALDKRCEGAYEFLPPEKVFYVKGSLKSRFLFYLNLKLSFDIIFCFGNIPPPIKVKSFVYTYFHNLLLLEQPESYPPVSKIMSKLKGLVIKSRKHLTNKFIVQSDNVKKALCRYLKIEESRCLVMPFYREMTPAKPFPEKAPEFVYISNGNPHKNHVNLLKAWEILQTRKGLTPPLHLTITREYQPLIDHIDTLRNKGLKIINHHFVDVKELYSKCKYSVYPSLIESFGLGLIESVATETEVIAADLPYVDAVIKPVSKFDPHSPESIAEAVTAVLKEDNPVFMSEKKIQNQIKDILFILQNVPQDNKTF